MTGAVMKRMTGVAMKHCRCFNSSSH